jgi:hypothetical protein
MNEYELQADKFLKETKTKFSYRLVGEIRGFPNDNKDNMPRFHFRATLRNAKHSFTFDFYGSNHDYMQNIQTLSAYDVLACLQKYKVSDELDKFAYDYGYEINNDNLKRISKIHKAVINEYENVCKLWNDNEINALMEIA